MIPKTESQKWALQKKIIEMSRPKENLRNYTFNTKSSNDTFKRKSSKWYLKKTSSKWALQNPCSKLKRHEIFLQSFPGNWKRVVKHFICWLRPDLGRSMTVNIERGNVLFKPLSEHGNILFKLSSEHRKWNMEIFYLNLVRTWKCFI